MTHTERFVTANGEVLSTRLLIVSTPPAPPPVPVPDRVTAASLLLVLGQMGKLAQVEGVIAGLPEAAPARILWGRATEFRRANPLWEAFAQTIGLTAADVDAAFIAAGQMDQAFSNG